MIILDTSAAKALAAGHKALSTLAGNMAQTPGDRLAVPALCLMQAEADDAGIHRKVLSFSAVDVHTLDTVDAVTVGTMVRDGYGGPDTCHALYCALPHTGAPGMSIVLTDDETRYPPGTVAIDINSPGMLGF
ncbi:hypothetical protein AB0C96_19325 [Streptomyces sp. NPDC048506]|uniref:hypothetical protein n=1 Tax=Streptomyces sp. NPDC048506 TaxID=3155028 RepID=UPI003417C18F